MGPTGIFWEIKSTFLEGGSTAEPHGLRSSGVPEKRPAAREAGEAPLMGPTGIFWGH